GTQKQSIPTPSQPALVLDDSCLKERDFSNSLMGQVKEVTAIPNLYTILSEEGFQSSKLTYLGGLWVLIGFDSLDILEKFRDSDVGKGFRNHWYAKERKGNDNEHSIHGEENIHSSDPFNIYELLQKKKDNIHQTKESDPTHPPGFTPELGNNNKEEGGSILDVMDDLVKVTPETPTATKLLVISVYAPQELSEKLELWGYLCSLIDRWDGETVVLGDFNEVRMEQERHLFDHRPIIMFESMLDYGPVPSRMFHSWFKMEGFNKFVEDSWDSMNVMDSNGLIRMKKKI
ncbi:RNA-directed DNA polymerase, eukaryota, partial [Tanacetum coccineum]